MSCGMQGNISSDLAQDLFLSIERRTNTKTLETQNEGRRVEGWRTQVRKRGEENREGPCKGAIKRKRMFEVVGWLTLHT